MPPLLFQIAGAAVIAQPLPQAHKLLLRQRRQRLYVRRGLHEPLEIRQHRLHTGLLEHDLRYPCAVGGHLLPPRQHPAVLIIPRQKGRGQFL